MNTRILKLTSMALFTLVALVQPGQGGILDDYYLQQFGETAAAPQKEVTVPTTDQLPARCGMPLKHDLRRDWNQLQPATQAILAKQLAAPVLSDIQDARPRPLNELELDLSDVRH